MDWCVLEWIDKKIEWVFGWGFVGIDMLKVGIYQGLRGFYWGIGGVLGGVWG
jgi:hypothetical protein